MPGRFDKKVAVVTGGSRGIGRAMVEAFARDGARVVFTYHRQEDKAREVAGATGARAVQCAQSDVEKIGATVDEVLAAHGALDILVNNAGVTDDQFLMLMTPESWDRVIDTNVNGTFRWVKAVSRPMLLAQRGVIINVASVSGLVGIAGQTNYAASKGAVIAFTRALAAEFGPKGIRVNAVIPGFIDTDMTARMPRQFKRESVDKIVAGRFGTPAEVASVAAFLASDEASYIIGQSIVVDGGLSSTAA
jgi:3-oxoacyl-[acyl-carrier protein] reductase